MNGTFYLFRTLSTTIILIQISSAWEFHIQHHNLNELWHWFQHSPITYMSPWPMWESFNDKQLLLRLTFFLFLFFFFFVLFCFVWFGLVCFILFSLYSFFCFCFVLIFVFSFFFSFFLFFFFENIRIKDKDIRVCPTYCLNNDSQLICLCHLDFFS